MGPSGSGKNTLGDYLSSEFGIPELISTVTRAPRQGEYEGHPYHFVDLETFQATDMMEVTEYPPKSGNFYGANRIEWETAMDTHDAVFAVLDRYGTEFYKKRYGDIVRVIYVVAPLQELAHRMVARGDDPELISKRLDNIEQSGELNNLDLADLCIVNTNLDVSKRLLKAYIKAN